MTVDNGTPDKPEAPDPVEPAGRSRLLVLGMHRSGTSVLTDILGRLGFYVGDEDELTNPSWQNPRGFFERRDIRKISDVLLHCGDAEWWKVSRFDADLLNRHTIAAQLSQIRSVAKDLDERGKWAIKEPRLCLVLPAFLPMIRNPAVVLIVRHPLEVAHSLRRRNGFPTVAGIALWEAYTRAALRNSAFLPRVIVKHHDLIAAPEDAIEKLAAALTDMGFGRFDTQNAIDAIEKGLHREHVDPRMLEQMSAPQIALWDALERDALDEVSAECSAATLSILGQFEADQAERVRTLDIAGEKNEKNKELRSLLKLESAKARDFEKDLGSLSKEHEKLARQLARCEDKLNRTLGRRIKRLIARIRQ